MGGTISTSKVKNSDDPILHIVDDFIKERVESVAKLRVKPSVRYLDNSFTTEGSKWELLTGDKTLVPDRNHGIFPSFSTSGSLETPEKPRMPKTVSLRLSVRALALRHHSTHKNSYIPQEALSSVLSSKKAILPVCGPASTRNTPLLSIDVTNPPSRAPAGEGLKKKPVLKIQIHDEDDWIQVYLLYDSTEISITRTPFS